MKRIKTFENFNNIGNNNIGTKELYDFLSSGQKVNLVVTNDDTDSNRNLTANEFSELALNKRDEKFIFITKYNINEIDQILVNKCSIFSIDGELDSIVVNKLNVYQFNNDVDIDR